MIYGVFLLRFMYEITFNFICFRKMKAFVLFPWICSGESVTVLFSSVATNIDSEIRSYLMQVKCFQLTFLEAIDCEDW